MLEIALSAAWFCCKFQNYCTEWRFKYTLRCFSCFLSPPLFKSTSLQRQACPERDTVSLGKVTKLPLAVRNKYGNFQLKWVIRVQLSRWNEKGSAGVLQSWRIPAWKRGTQNDETPPLVQVTLFHNKKKHKHVTVHALRCVWRLSYISCSNIKAQVQLL